MQVNSHTNINPPFPSRHVSPLCPNSFSPHLSMMCVGHTSPPDPLFSPPWSRSPCDPVRSHSSRVNQHFSSLSEVHPAWPPAGGHACAQGAASSPNLLAGRAPALLLVACAHPYTRVRAIGRRVAPPSSRFLTSFPTSRRSFVPPRSPRRRAMVTWRRRPTRLVPVRGRMVGRARRR